MNLYRFIIDTDNIKSDNIFTVQAKSYEEARKEIIDATTQHPFNYLSIVLVYSTDSTVDDDHKQVFYAVRSDYESDT